MDKHSSTQPTAATPSWLRWVRALLAIAILGAGYLAWLAFHHGPAVGCGPESGCNKVLQSRWAYWLDIPVSVPAVLVYLLLLGATILLQKKPAPDDQRGSWAAIIILSVIVVGAALWFIGLQVFVIHAFCKFCLTAHACALIAAWLCLKNIPVATDPETPMWTPGSGKWGVPRSAIGLLAVIGLAGVVALAGGQMLFQKQRNVVKALPVIKPPPAITNQATAASAGLSAKLPESPQVHLIAPRTLSLYSNQFLIKLEEVPMIGSPDAPHIIVYLFDYTCPHCRALHPYLVTACRQLTNQLGVVCLPMPLSSGCNRYFLKSAHSVTNSCEYIRLGLAVWRAKPEAHREFDDWMFAGEKPPGLPQAEEFAAQLVGAEKLKLSLADPWIKGQIELDTQIHRVNWVTLENPALPQLMIGNAVSSGPLNSVQHLMILLNHYLGLKPGRPQF